MKKKYKLILLTISLTMIILMLTGCNETKKAEETVSTVFKSYNKMDFETVKGYLDSEPIKDSNNGNTDEDNEVSQIIIKAICEGLQHKIISSEKVDADNVIVQAEIIAVDMKAIMGEYLQKAMPMALANAFSTDALSEEEQKKAINDLLIEIVSKPELAKITSNIDINVQKVDKKWIIKVDDNFRNAFLGGLQDINLDSEKP